MLVLTIRNRGEFTVGTAVIQVLEIHGNTIRIGITADKEIPIRRVKPVESK